MSKTVSIRMANYNMSMTEGKVETWFVDEGDNICVDMELAEVSENKEVHIIKSKVNGILTKILVKEGENAMVGAELAIIITTED